MRGRGVRTVVFGCVRIVKIAQRGGFNRSFGGGCQDNGPAERERGGPLVRTRRFEMRRKGLRRLDLWLADNHWVWRVPTKSRTAVARKWLELKAPTEALEERVRTVEEGIGALREAVERVERKVDGLLGDGRKRKGQDAGGRDAPTGIDPEDFLEI